MSLKFHVSLEEVCLAVAHFQKKQKRLVAVVSVLVIVFVFIKEINWCEKINLSVKMSSLGDDRHTSKISV